MSRKTALLSHRCTEKTLIRFFTNLFFCKLQESTENFRPPISQAAMDSFRRSPRVDDGRLNKDEYAQSDEPLFPSSIPFMHSESQFRPIKVLLCGLYWFSYRNCEQQAFHSDISKARKFVVSTHHSTLA